MRPDVRVRGLEIDPARVASAQSWSALGVEFALGGFEIPLPRGRQARVIRAFNVLRLYDETEVEAPWATMIERLGELTVPWSFVAPRSGPLAHPPTQRR